MIKQRAQRFPLSLHFNDHYLITSLHFNYYSHFLVNQLALPRSDSTSHEVVIAHFLPSLSSRLHLGLESVPLAE